MKKHKIVLIEDDKLLSKALSEELKESGFDVVQAFDGIEGFKAVKTEKPNLIILDIIMLRKILMAK